MGEGEANESTLCMNVALLFSKKCSQLCFPLPYMQEGPLIPYLPLLLSALTKIKKTFKRFAYMYGKVNSNTRQCDWSEVVCHDD